MPGEGDSPNLLRGLLKFGTVPACFETAPYPTLRREFSGMDPNPVLGVVFHWLGGLASGSFYVPYRAVRKWSWETYWLVGGIFSWIICPWLFAFFMTNDLAGVLKQQTAGTI